ncbi:hypothetical protein [Streptomyces sp. NPDC048295]|uniref:hypothetical protein n=1 Tax=Streptomyces sp. NPDC048295 TaxID=3154617 RepID=UPI00342032A0
MRVEQLPAMPGIKLGGLPKNTPAMLRPVLTDPPAADHVRTAVPVNGMDPGDECRHHSVAGGTDSRGHPAVELGTAIKEHPAPGFPGRVWRIHVTA